MIQPFCVIAGILYFINSTQAQIPSFIDQAGIKSISSESLSSVYNAAFLANENKSIIGIKGMNFYSIDGLSSIYAQGVFSMKTQGMGFYVGQMGFSSISQMDAGFSYGIKLSNHTNIGVRAKYFQLRTFDQTMNQNLHFDLSTVYFLNTRSAIASHIENIASSNKAFDVLNTQIHIGLRCDISKEVRFYSEFSKEMMHPLLFKYNVQYTYQKKLQLSWGGNWNPQSYFIGLAYQWGKIKCEVDVKTHSVLGQAYSTGIYYMIDRK